MSSTSSEPGFLWRWYEEGLRLLFKAYFTGVHRIRIEGIERVPKGKDKLIVIANHASYLDGIIIWTYLRLPFRIVVDRTVASRLWLRPFLKNRYVVPLDFMNPYALKDVVHMVEEGLPLLVFPEGRRTSTGHIMKIYDGTGFAAFRTGARILPVYLRNTYNTIFARKHKGRRLFAPIAMTVGELQLPFSLESLPSRKRRTAAARRIYAMLTGLYLEAHNKPSTLGREFFRICKENRGRIAFNDSTGHRVSYRKALLGALVLGQYLSRLGGNIAMMLPNLSVTAIIFMGMQIFRKAPILLNYSSGSAALGLAMERAEADVVVTSRQLLQRMRLPEAVFGPRKCIFLEDLLDEIAFGDKVRAFIRFLFPGPLSAIRAGEEKETAAILFTSGSEGVPKGVCLSHENIITNVYQGLSRVDVSPEDHFLNVLPLFHSFGLTVGFIIPLFARARTFFHMSPLHYKIVPELAYDRECTILLATNTFLNGYARRANPYDFHTMRYVFCGGEPLSDAVFERFAKTFGIRILSGYGATECSPMVSIGNALLYEYGTAGTVLPGIESRLAPVEGIDDKKGAVGSLLVRGKNVTKGYLKDEAANRKYLVEDEGWYDTGDLVEMTEEGSVKIIGRLRRFAKVSGEMISLAAVEEVLVHELAGRRDLAVVAMSDERRGERLVVVTNDARIDQRRVRDTLKGRGFPDLAVPRTIRFMKDIPKLGSGKIDYVGLKGMIGPS